VLCVTEFDVVYRNHNLYVYMCLCVLMY
jgi:hypothetical protein